MPSSRSHWVVRRFPPGPKSSSAWRQPNRDERAYDDPEALDIDRSGVRHLAFGRHPSLPRRPARPPGGQIALGTLLRRFPTRLAVADDELRWGHGDGLVLRGLSELPVIPGPACRDSQLDRPLTGFAVRLPCTLPGAGRKASSFGRPGETRARTMSMTGTPVDNVNVAALLEARGPDGRSRGGTVQVAGRCTGRTAPTATRLSKASSASAKSSTTSGSSLRR